LRFERLGRGVFLISNNPPDEKPVTGPTDIIYGINISPFGTLSQNLAIDGISLNIFPTSVGRVNGVLVSWPGFSTAETMNGLQISFLASVASDISGIQAGIGNFAKINTSGFNWPWVPTNPQNLGDLRFLHFITRQQLRLPDSSFP